MQFLNRVGYLPAANLWKEMKQLKSNLKSALVNQPKSPADADLENAK